MAHGEAIARLTYTWQDNADNERGYRVERSSDGANFAAIASVPADVTRFADDSVVAGRRYWYRVAGFNVGGDSLYSPVVDAVAPLGPPAPNTAPTISPMPDGTVHSGMALPVVPFVIGDAETPADALSLIANSSNPNLVPVENIRFGGGGTSRHLIVTPRAGVTGWSTIWVKVGDGALTSVSSFVFVVTEPDPARATGRLSNLSTRGRSSDADPLLVGFVIVGDGTKQVLVRAIGPTLGQAPFFVSATLPDPCMALMKWDGSGYRGHATSLDWGSDGNPGQTGAVASAVGAFPLSVESRDAALVMEFSPGQYTSVVSDEGGGAGVALAELYDVDGAAGARLANVSTRGHVGTGGDVMIAGFVVSGEGWLRVLIRAVGPGLAPAPFNLSGTLPDPEIEVYRQTPGGDSVSVFRQDNWSEGNAAETASVSARVGAFSLHAGSGDAAAVLTLGPGVYTAIVRGKDAGTGTALVEVYDAND